MIVRELVARLGLDFDGTGFVRAEKAIGTLTKQIGSIAGLGAVWVAAAGGIAVLTNEAIDQADALHDLGEELGTSTQSLQQLGYAATMSGSNADAMTGALSVLNRSVGEAMTGNEGAAKAFSALGISIKGADGQARATDEVFFEVADAIAAIESPAERAATGMQFFGREGRKLGPFLAQGSAAIRQLGEEAIATGAVFDTEFVNKSGDFNDAMDRIRARLTGIRNVMANAFLPIMTRGSKAIEAFFKFMQPTLLSVFESGVRLIGAPLRALGDGIGFVADQVTALQEYLGPLFNNLLAIVGVTALLALAFLSPGIALFLLGALIAAILEDFQTFLDGGESVIGDLIDSFGNFVGEIGELFTGLGQSIADFWTNTIQPPIDEFFAWVSSKIDAFSSSIKSFVGSIPGASLISGGIGAVGSFIGGGAASPAADASQRVPTAIAQNQSTVVAPSTNTQITVNAAPGQSAEDVGKSVQERFTDHLSDEIQAAFGALVPAVR